MKTIIYIIKAYTNGGEYEVIQRAFANEAEAQVYGAQWQAAVEATGSTARFEVAKMTVLGG